MSKAIDHFKLKDFKPRESQVRVINAAEEAFSKKDILIVEAPVGSGKSGIALALARWLGQSHILTPRKSLQDQYYEDFPDELAIMKGKSGYPCYPRLSPMDAAVRGKASNGNTVWFPTYQNMDANPEDYRAVTDLIRKRIPVANMSSVDCSEGPCSSSNSIKANCENDGDRPCPYHVALNVANLTDHVVHNVHSFFYQTMFGARFEERDLIVIDEAHDLEGIIRDFLRTRIMLSYADVPENLEPSSQAPVEEWVDWFLQSKGLSFKKLQDLYPDEAFGNQLHKYFSERDMWVREESASDGSSKVVSTPEKKFSESLAKLMITYEDMDGDPPIVSIFRNTEKRRMEYTFTPSTLVGKAESLILHMGKKVLLMSGTVYGKSTFCRNLGINPDSAEYIRIDSDFPIGNRPIILRSDLSTDNSFSSWNSDPEVQGKMVTNICRIMDAYKDKKGLIHAPSYSSARHIASLISSDRIVTHGPHDFLSVLRGFVEDTESNKVLISPTCQQGVDFKGDIARFQMILRVPYLSTEDEFIHYMMKNNFNWYNYHSLVVFGQQIGRVVRGPSDWGHTYLLDSRFKKYLQRNRRSLPPWLTAAIQFK